jgi:DNA mismatch repair protein MutH
MNNLPYNPLEKNSIISFAKEFIGKSIESEFGKELNNLNLSNRDKGQLGKVIEELYFKYKPNSDSNADFIEAGLELKSSGLKILKRSKEYRAKERLVLSIINYIELLDKNFEDDFLEGKNSHLLLIFYLYEKGLNQLSSIIKLVGDWKFPKEDIPILKNDWQIIYNKVKLGLAHELSEGDTFYLGACTKGGKGGNHRNQPNSNIKAKQRAYSLKPGYLNHIIANIAQEETAVYGKIIERPEVLDIVQSIEEIVISKFQPFYGKSAEEIAEKFDLHFNPKAKNYFASITNAVLKAILGIEQDKTIEEFEKADIQVKTIRVEQNNRIEQSVSFPAFDFIQIYNESWRESELKDLTEKKFLFLFFKNTGNEYVFDKVKFWNMPFTDRNEVRKVWLRTKKIIQTGEIIKGYKTDKNGKVSRQLNFPKKTENNVWHVRPHGQTTLDTKPLPVMEKETKEMSFTKQCFWMNWDYLRDEIYLK